MKTFETSSFLYTHPGDLFRAVKAALNRLEQEHPGFQIESLSFFIAIHEHPYQAALVYSYKEDVKEEIFTEEQKIENELALTCDQCLSFHMRKHSIKEESHDPALCNNCSACDASYPELDLPNVRSIEKDESHHCAMNDGKQKCDCYHEGLITALNGMVEHDPKTCRCPNGCNKPF